MRASQTLLNQASLGSFCIPSQQNFWLSQQRMHLSAAPMGSRNGYSQCALRANSRKICWRQCPPETPHANTGSRRHTQSLTPRTAQALFCIPSGGSLGAPSWSQDALKHPAKRLSEALCAGIGVCERANKIGAFTKRYAEQVPLVIGHCRAASKRYREVQISRAARGKNHEMDGKGQQSAVWQVRPGIERCEISAAESSP
ncbi:MAG: hypothetical protein JWP34_3967 [Massilia sp.]|nr:hypothetical protein [Massilia sp.]